MFLWNMKKLKCNCDSAGVWREFKALKEAMEDIGYKWVPNPKQSSNVPGAHFRVPEVNPNRLPPPKNVNQKLREAFENACEAPVPAEP